MNFWQAIKKPIIGLSPMDGVSDAPFRYITAKYGKPDIIITEFISVDGIVLGGEKLFVDFLYDEIERPVLAQVFGNEPKYFYIAAKVVAELGFDGLDINMGCPARSVSARGAGAGLILRPDLAREIIIESKRAVADWVENGIEDLPENVKQKIASTKEKLIQLGVKIPSERKLIPVSVKTRVGYDHIVVEEWIENLMQTHPANISIHGRTLKQMYAGLADWEAIGRGAAVVRKLSDPENPTTVLGNGDVHSLKMANEMIEKHHLDGVLIGRATFGNPWLFNGQDQAEVDSELKIKVAYEHAEKFMQIKEPHQFVEMRKHFGWYIKGLPQAAHMRAQLMQAADLASVRQIFDALVLDNPSSNK